MSTEFITFFLNEMKTKVPGFIAASINEIETGKSHGAISVDRNFDPTLASSYNLNVVRTKLQVIKALKLDQEIDDILITLTNHIHIIALSPSKNYMIYLAADSKRSNLGMTRLLIKKYKKEVEDSLQ